MLDIHLGTVLFVFKNYMWCFHSPRRYICFCSRVRLCENLLFCWMPLKYEFCVPDFHFQENVASINMRDFICICTIYIEHGAFSRFRFRQLHMEWNRLIDFPEYLFVLPIFRKSACSWLPNFSIRNGARFDKFHVNAINCQRWRRSRCSVLFICGWLGLPHLQRC